MNNVVELFRCASKGCPKRATIRIVSLHPALRNRNIVVCGVHAFLYDPKDRRPL